MEADAVATQTKFSYEMAEKGDSAAWKALKTSHRGVADTFKNAAEKADGQTCKSRQKNACPPSKTYLIKRVKGVE